MFKYLLPVLWVFSSGVYAESLQHMAEVNNNQQQMDKSLESLQKVDFSDDVYIDSYSKDGVVLADRIEQLSTKFKDSYITKEQAKVGKFEQVKVFTIDSDVEFDNLIKKIESQVTQDSPNYFSVDLYQNSIGDTEITDYVARITEYK